MHERATLDDEYLSTEHILLAMTEVAGGVGDVLRGFGVTHDAVLDALKSVRGSHRVTSDNPEEQYEALEKYGRDLTEDARAAAASIRSSGATRRSGASSRCSRGARRTTRC